MASFATSKQSEISTLELYQIFIQKYGHEKDSSAYVENFKNLRKKTALKDWLAYLLIFLPVFCSFWEEIPHDIGKGWKWQKKKYEKYGYRNLRWDM